MGATRSESLGFEFPTDCQACFIAEAAQRHLHQTQSYHASIKGFGTTYAGVEPLYELHVTAAHK